MRVVGSVMQGQIAEGWTAWKLWRGWRAALLLALLCLSVYLPGFTSTPAVDRDESRFAQASRQMLESGDLVVPRVQGKLRLNKPPLIYWLQAGSAWLLTDGDARHDAIWMYRLPSLLAAIGVVLATWRIGSRLYSPLAGVLAGCMIAVSPVFWWEARQARADMVLVLCTLVAVSVVMNYLKRRDDAARSVSDGTNPSPQLSSLRLSVPSSLLLWLAVGAGVMTKGPVTLLVVGLGILMACIVRKQWRWVWGLRPILGLLLLAACVAPWVSLVTRHVGFDVWWKTVLNETLGRSLEPKEGHGGFPGYHTLFLPLLFFPGSVFVGVGIWKAIKDRAQHTGVNLLCFIAPTWLVMELVGTKLPHYTMPVYPLLAILSAAACCVGASELRELFSHLIVRWAIAAWALAVPCFAIAAAGVMGYAVVELGWLAAAGCLIIGLGLAALFAGSAARALQRADWPRAVLIGLVTFSISAAMLGIALPRLDKLWVSRKLARQIRHLDPAGTYPIAAVSSDPAQGIVGYNEDSLVFETRGRIERITPDDLRDWFRRNPTGIAVVPGSMLIGATPYVPLTAASGFNYSKGRLVYLCTAGLRQ